MEIRYITALIAFLGGALISLGNAILTAKEVKGENKLPIPAAAIRQITNIIYFVGTYFLIRKLGIASLLPLLGAAVGLTVPSILFAITIAKNMKGDD